MNPKSKPFHFLKSSFPTCTRCSLHRTRLQPVWGEGSEEAEIMIIGEAPGKEENITGRPFIGRSGQFLRNSLLELNIDLNKIFITNIVCCRPPNNRLPFRDEIVACNIWLSSKLLYIKPKAIFLLGNTAISSFVGEESVVVTDYVMKPFQRQDRWILCNYHPSWAIRGITKAEKFKKVLEFNFNFVKDLDKGF